MGMMVYWRFSGITQQNIVDNNRKMMDQTVDSIENYLVNMRQISDAAYYDVIKENDIREQNESIHKGLNLLYEANKENLGALLYIMDTEALWQQSRLLPRKKNRM